MITKRDINRLREMVRFELSKEIKKGVSRLVTNVRQRKNSEFRISICSAPVLHSTKGVVHVNEKTVETFGNCEDKHGLPFQIFVTVFFAYSFIIYGSCVRQNNKCVMESSAQQNYKQKHGKGKNTSCQNDGFDCYYLFHNMGSKTDPKDHGSLSFYKLCL